MVKLPQCTGTRLSVHHRIRVCFRSSQEWNPVIIIFRGIYHYSTTHTSEAVFIIGGHHTGNIVAEFRDNQWQQVATLKQGRSRHGSITFGGQTVIIGGAYGHEISFTTIAPE